MTDEKYVEYHKQGFMDKCASAGLTQEQSDELYKQANPFLTIGKGLWNAGKKFLGSGASKGKDALKWVGKNKGKTALNTAMYGPLAYQGINMAGNAMGLWGGDGQPQQQPGAAGPQGPQLPQRGYGQAKLNVRGMGGITPYLT